MARLLIWFGRHRVTGPSALVLVVFATLATIAARSEIMMITGAEPGFEVFSPVFLLLPLLTSRRYWILCYGLALIYGWNWILPKDQTAIRKSVICIIVLLEALLIGEVINTLRVAIRVAEQAKSRAEHLQTELTHRVQNVLAIVLSLIAATDRQNHTTASRALEILQNKVMALCLANRSLRVGPNAPEFELQDFLLNLLSPYQPQTPHLPDAVRLLGPRVMCPASILTPLGLAVHELATNAAKHGALSAKGGSLCVVWSLFPDPGTGQMHLRVIWQETLQTPLQPPLPAPREDSFGMGLMDTCAQQLNGRFTHHLRSSGLRATFECPLPDRPAIVDQKT